MNTLHVNNRLTIIDDGYTVITSSPFSTDMIHQMKQEWSWWADNFVTLILDGRELSVKEAYAVEKEILQFAEGAILTSEKIVDIAPTKYEEMAADFGYAA